MITRVDDNSQGDRFSWGHFLASLSLILVGLLAFPIYQALKTGGVIFYANAIDESSYLSYPFASYVKQAFVMHRVSSYLVLWLHEHGMSGGYCNVLFDVLASVGIVLGLYRLLFISGYDRDRARCGAVLVFILPLLFGPLNPVFDLLRSLSLSDRYLEWVVSPVFPELPFARSPEPQLSFLVVVVWLNLFVRSRLLFPMSLVLVPVLYSFVRLPVLFICVALVGHKRWNLVLRLIIAWIAVGCAMGLFRFANPNPQTLWHSFNSRLPMVSVMGIVAVCLLIFLRGRVPTRLQPWIPVLVASTWVGPNVQVVSGAYAAPAHFEHFYSVAVVGFLAAILIIERSAQRRLWVEMALLIFVIQSVLSFRENLSIFVKLHQPRQSLAIVRESAERVGVSDLLLASYLDLAFPEQPATVFSFNKTHDIISDRSYIQYVCARRFIEKERPQDLSFFQDTFARLDYGYQVRGIDIINTAGRVGIRRKELPDVKDLLYCTGPPPFILR